MLKIQVPVAGAPTLFAVTSNVRVKAVGFDIRVDLMELQKASAMVQQSMERI